ncbi:SseB family protein [Legionella impletisoli]|nr:SseB family protein [Legionella impletisoli]
MNPLETAILNAFQQQGAQKEANKAYLEFIKANFIIPIEVGSETEPKVLYLIENEHIFLPVFSHMDYFDAWAAHIAERIQLLKLSGVDLLKGIGEGVTVCLNIGSVCYKEFNPAEIARMRSMVLKFFNN